MHNIKLPATFQKINIQSWGLRPLFFSNSVLVRGIRKSSNNNFEPRMSGFVNKNYTDIQGTLMVNGVGAKEYDWGRHPFGKEPLVFVLPNLTVLTE